MKHHKHEFVEKYQGLKGVGMDRETDQNTLIYLLQKFSDDNVMAVLSKRLTDQELNEIVDLIYRLLKKHLSEEEYHDLFLKED